MTKPHEHDPTTPQGWEVDAVLNLGPIKIVWDRKSKSGLIVIPALYYLAYFGKTGAWMAYRTVRSQ